MKIGSAIVSAWASGNRFRVTFDTNRYSVPAEYASQRLTLKSYPERLCIYHEDRLVAWHLRSYERHRDFEHPDRHLRTLLVHGARSILSRAPGRTDRRSRWVVATRERRGWNIAAVALANKNARTAWAVLARGAEFDAGHVGRAA